MALDPIFSNTDSNNSTFRITELADASEQTSGDQNSKPLSAPIIWTAQGYSKPRESWKIKKHLRTSRTDYSDKPTEQVLGVIFEPFTLSGVWDNKYNGGPQEDFAWTMKEAFEALQSRGNLCEFAFDDISIRGLITDFEFNYHRRSYIGYSFTVSPHYNTTQSQPRQIPKLAPAAQTFDQQLQNAIANAKIRHQLAPAPYMIRGAVTLITGYPSLLQQVGRSINDQVTQYINAWDISSNNIHDIITNRVLNAGPFNQVSGFGPGSATNSSTAIQRLLQELSAMDSVSEQVIGFLKAAKYSTDLVYQDGTQCMNYFAWANNMKLVARQMIEISFNARQEFERLVQNDILSIYRPAYLESLYSISTKFYGDPNMWRKIYQQNDLAGLVLQGDELLIIPKV